MIAQNTGHRATVLISGRAAFVLSGALVVGACAAAIDSSGASSEIRRDQPTPRADAPNTAATTNQFGPEHLPFSYAGSTALRGTSNGEKPRGLKPAARNPETGNALERRSSRAAVDAPASERSPGRVVAAGVVQPVVSRGQELYAKHCALCHGDSGDGGGKFAYLMNPRPRNFQDGKFKLSTTQNQIPTDGDLFRTISSGMPGSAMPPWGHLPKSDIDALVTYVRQIHVEATSEMLKDWIREGTIKGSELRSVLDKRTKPGSALVVPSEPSFDDLRWFRGRRLYLENCASCHGSDGEPVADEVKFDAEGYPVPPRSFVQGIFKGGSQGHQLYARIWKGMKGTPMPSSEGVYSGDEMWDIIHYVQSLMREGAQDRAQLKQGTFVAPRVTGNLPDGPMDASWEQARALYVGLTPLWWDEQRIEGLVVSALHNGKELAIRLSWIDPSLDDRAVRHDEFRDGVAIQFSLSSDPPFYMGGTGDHGGVNIWYWKADRQKDIETGYQDVDAAFPDRAVDMYPEQRFKLVDMSVTEWPHEQITKHDPEFITAWGAGNLVSDPNLDTPVECLVARGPGTLSGKPANAQLVKGQAVYERGLWYVQLRRAMSLPAADGHGDERMFKPGDYLPVSFAIWNGSAGDRDGKKNISIWQKLVIE